MMRFVDVKNDVAFRKIFGNEKKTKILLSFLNAVLKLEGDHELETLIEKWVFFIKHAEELEVIPENVKDDGLLEAYKDADRHSWTKEELKSYDNASIAEQDERGRISRAKKQGLEQGLEVKTYNVIDRCYEDDMSIETIARITDLSLDEVSKIIEEIKKKKAKR